MKTDKKPDVLAAFAMGMSWREASEASGVAVSTIWRWAKDDPEFDAEIRAACADVDAEVEAVTFANCIDPDPAHNSLRMFWLKCRRPNVYQDRTAQQHSGEISVSHTYVEPGLPPAPRRAESGGE